MQINKQKYDFILFGGNRLEEKGPLTNLALFLKKKKFSYLCIVDKLHIKKKVDKSNNLRKILNNSKIQYLVLKKIKLKFLKNITKRNSLGLSLNSVWKFKPEIINLFNGNLFNYHAADLPTERGAANLSWRILMRKRHNNSICIHRINENYDEGDIVIKKKINFKDKLLPEKQYRLIRNNERLILNDFIMKHAKRKKIISKKQRNSKSFYWPKLDAKVNGKINWDWSADDIVLFIKSFSKPFSGAFSFIEKKKITIFDAKKIKSKIKFHPFQNGLIYRFHKNTFYIASGNFSVLVAKKDSKGISGGDKYYLGKRFV